MDKWAYRAGERVMESAEDLNKKLRKLKGHTRENPVFQPLGSKQAEASQDTSRPKVDRGTTKKPSSNVTQKTDNKVWGMTEKQWNNLPDYERNRMMQGWGLNGYRPKERMTGDSSALVRNRPSDLDTFINKYPFSTANPVQTPTGRVSRTVEDFLASGSNKANPTTPPRQVDVQPGGTRTDPITVEEIRGMQRTTNRIGDDSGQRWTGQDAWKNDPELSKYVNLMESKMYDQKGHPVRDPELWRSFISPLMQTRLGGETDIQQSQISADASRYGSDRSAAASMYGADQRAEATRYSSDRNVEAARLRAEQTGSPADVTPDAIKYGQEAYKTMIGQGYTPEEAQDVQRRAEFEYKAKMNQGQLFRNKKDGTEAWVMPDGTAYDSYGYPIQADPQPGPQASVAPQTTNRVAQNQPRQIKSWMNDWDWNRSDLRNRTV